MIDSGLLLAAAVAVACGILVYAVIARGLFLVSEPLRSAALDLAEQLLKSDEVGEVDKRVVELTLNELHSSPAAWFMALRAFRVLFFASFHRGADTGEQPGVDPISAEMAPILQRYQLYWMLATMANSPAAALIFSALSLLGAAFSMSAAMLAALLAKSHDGDHGHGRGHVNA